MNKVFVSHTSDEAAIASFLGDFVKKAFLGQISIFVSDNIEHLTPGKRWLEMIEEALNSSQVILLLCSPSSLTRPWINFEAGCGWIKKLKIIPICHSGLVPVKLPFPINTYQGLTLEDGNFCQNLIKSLVKAYDYDVVPSVDTETFLKELADAKTQTPIPAISPMLLNSNQERTQLINNDLKTLSHFDSEILSKETIWISSFLSIFAIDPSFPVSDGKPDDTRLFLEEQRLLIALAEKGCKIKCIISPPNENYIKLKRIEYARPRLEYLIKFLTSNHPALENIKWVISEVEQKNLYLIGNVSCFEGYKKGLQDGFGLTLRQTDPAIIHTYQILFETFFEQLSKLTFNKYVDKKIFLNDEKEAFRRGIVKGLKTSLKYCESFADSQSSAQKKKSINRKSKKR